MAAMPASHAASLAGLPVCHRQKALHLRGQQHTSSRMQLQVPSADTAARFSQFKHWRHKHLHTHQHRQSGAFHDGFGYGLAAKLDL